MLTRFGGSDAGAGKEVTRHGPYSYLEYPRFADDLVILVDAYP
jgi:hypothetical protein